LFDFLLQHLLLLLVLLVLLVLDLHLTDLQLLLAFGVPVHLIQVPLLLVVASAVPNHLTNVLEEHQTDIPFLLPQRRFTPSSIVKRMEIFQKHHYYSVPN
jgi:hypothetical protein